MATDATPGGTNVVGTATGRIDIRATAAANLSPKVPPWASLEPRHAARLLEHVRTWQRRLRDAVDRHYDPRAYDVAPELHDVVDRASADLVRVFGDVGLRAPVEAHDGPRPRRGQLSMAVLHAPDVDRAAVATGDPDVAVAALTGWATWLEDRAAAMPAPITAGAQADRKGDDPRLDEYRPATYFRVTGSDVPGRLRNAKRDGKVSTRPHAGRGNLYRVGDVAALLNLTSAQLDKLDEEYDKRQLKDPARRENA